MNARDELIKHMEGRVILCASATRGHDWGDPVPAFNLRVGHSTQDYVAFLDSLNFEYDNGYGGQEVFGVIWYADGTWSDRAEYDGSEWWVHRVVPPIPAELRTEGAKS